jgi:hypothetical protein
MTGVDILAMEEVAVESAFNSTTFVIIFGLVTLIGIVSGLVAHFVYGHDVAVIPTLIFAFMIGGSIVGSLGGWSTATPAEYETQYKVTISEEVSMTEFLEKYEIIETEGKIYTVREK